MRMGRHVGRGPRGARCWHMVVVGVCSTRMRMTLGSGPTEICNTWTWVLGY